MSLVARANEKRYPITDDWRSEAERRMGELGITRTEVAQKLNVTYATVHNMLSGARNSSSLVPDFHKLVGRPPPEPLIISNDYAELRYIYERLPESSRAALLELAKKLK